MVITMEMFQNNVPKYFQIAETEDVTVTRKDGASIKVAKSKPSRKELAQKVCGIITGEATEQDGIDERIRQYESLD